MPLRRRIQYQGIAQPPWKGILPTEEPKWHQPWSEPVRQKIAPTLAVALIAASGAFSPPVYPVLFEGAAVSAEAAGLERPVQIQYQAKTEPVLVPAGEEVTTDKWYVAFSDPVRRRGLGVSLQQAAIGPVLADTQLTDKLESRWHQPWSEPARLKSFHASRQQVDALTAVQPTEAITPDKWIYPWSEPIRSRAVHASRQQVDAFVAPVAVVSTTIAVPSTVSVGVQYESRIQYQAIAQPAFTPVVETITPDKWIYAWSEPVRQKPGLGAALQQAFIAPVLTDTQLTDRIESRWHQPWTEPVRIKPQLPAGEQQFLAQGDVFSPENVTTDKWIYPWSEPVRQKPGLKSNLQQAFIAPVLNDRQLTETFESRWHYAWSEPVRFRAFQTSQQQALAFVAIPPPEIVTQDKWHYPWSEPVRQKPGLSAGLQQSFSATTIPIATATIAVPSTVSVGVQYETRIQYQATVVPVFVAPTETITPDKWIYAWSEPVRQKPGLLAARQQALIAPVLTPEVFTPDKWLVAWTDPPKKNRLLTGDQQFLAQGPVVPIEVIYEDKWHFTWSEPVRLKKGIGAHLQSSFTADTIVIPTKRIATWLYPWSEPVRQKIGLQAWLQRTTSLEAPPFPIFPTNLPWFAWLNEPVRLKPGVSPALQSFLIPSLAPITNVVTLVISATEINSDRALFGLMIYNTPSKAYVSIKEIQAVQNAALSTEELQAIRNAAASIEES